MKLPSTGRCSVNFLTPLSQVHLTLTRPLDTVVGRVSLSHLTDQKIGAQRKQQRVKQTNACLTPGLSGYIGDLVILWERISWAIGVFMLAVYWLELVRLTRTRISRRKRPW